MAENEQLKSQKKQLEKEIENVKSQLEELKRENGNWAMMSLQEWLQYEITAKAPLYSKWCS